MTRSFDVIGTTVPKRDGAEEVTGRTRYLHDLVLPRLAHGKILSSRHPHARLVRVDTPRAGAPLVHEELGGNAHTLRYQFSRGDVDRALAEAAAVVEDTYRLPFVTQACLGTMVALADWDPVGNLTMWTTTQVPFLYRRDLGEALGIAGDRVRVL